jgi:hypothetical protein
VQQMTISIRELLLEEIQAQQPKSQIDAPLSQTSVLNAAAKRLGRGSDEAILTQWGELFRAGLLAWGLNLSNPNPPFFHLTDTGRRALAHLTRDPSNPDGYMRHLASLATVNDVAMSYLKEGLDCYVAGLYKGRRSHGWRRGGECHSRPSRPDRPKARSARQNSFQTDQGLAYQDGDR